MNRIRITFLIFGLFGLANLVSAQQAPLFNQYFTQPSLGYASASVLSHSPQLSLLYRGQWSGLEGAPEIFALSFSNPLKNKWGYNVNVHSFEFGFLKQTYLGAGFSKAFNLKAHQLSVGTEIGASLYRLNESKISIESLNDELIQNLLGRNGSALNMNLSLSYQYRSLLAHFSALNIIDESLSNDDFVELNDNNRADYMAALGYAFRINSINKIVFTPIITWRYKEVLGGTFDLAAKLDLNDKFQLSTGYRENYGATAGIGVKLKSNMLFTYNYDFGKSDVPFVSDGFNEIGLHFTFQNKKEKSLKLETEALSIIDKIQKDEIYERKLISTPDQEVVLAYLSSLEKGNKKEREIKANEAFEDILSAVKNKGLARLQAEANERKEAERLAQLEAQNRAQEQEDRLAQEAKDKALAEHKLLEGESVIKEEVDDNQVNGDYILVVNSFTYNSALAAKNLNSLKETYPNSGIFKSKKRGYDYVYIMAFSDFDKAIEAMLALKKENKFSDSWVHTVRLSLEK